MVNLAKKFLLRRRGTEKNDLTTTTSSMEGSMEFADKIMAEKQAAATLRNDVASEEGQQSSSDAVPDSNVQEGVKRAEATTLTWSKTSLTIAYIFMFLLYFVNAFQASITGNLTPYVLSAFDAHSLIPVISIVTNVMSAATYLPVAKVLDLWGRPLGFAIMAVFATLGLILSAATTSVESYAAAQVFYSIGFTGMIFSVDVITSDTSSLRDRGLAFSFTSSPYIITAFAGPAAAEGFYDKISWRWAFGTFAIILPFVAAPLFGVLKINESRARKNGLLVEVPSGRTVAQSIWYHLIQFDALGVFLLAAGLVLFLLPFSLADNTAESWKSAYILSMLVIGSILLVSFIMVERFVSPVPFIPYKLLVSRTVLGVCLLDFSYQIAYYCWGSYFTSYLQVVYGLSITQAGWVSGIYDIIAGLWLLCVGWLIRRTGYFKWLIMCAVPLYTLAVGLMIYFRQPSMSVGFVIMCQVFIAFGGATMTLVEQVGILAASDHKDVAALLALLGLIGYIGGAIGNSISGAIWTNTLPQELQRLLPGDVQSQWEDIYDDLDTQLSFPKGTPERDAIIASYGIAQKRMLIAGTAIMALAFVSLYLIKNLQVTRRQMKGLVF